MPDAKPNRDLQEIEHETQRDILYALTNPDDNQPPWSLEDLPARWKTPASSTPSTALHRVGLVTRTTTEGYVFATRAAIRQIQIIGRVG